MIPKNKASRIAGTALALGRFFQKRQRSLLITSIVAVLCVLAPEPARAWSPFGLESVAQEAVEGIVFGISWLLALVAGVIVAIEAWFLHVILYINFGLVNSSVVKVGFPIVLAFANLAFVAGMIVIAIATILRRDQYGVKKILWKLVVMAIMVNFGLVICGALLKISDDMTLFFINSVNPAGSGDGGSGGEFFGTDGFANSIAGAFSPGGFSEAISSIEKNPALSAEELSGWAATGNAAGEIIKPLIGVLAALGSFVIIIITLGTLCVMLLYRYVKMGMLLITLPLAWAAFVFPAYEEHYKKWWAAFTKWVIFPPVVVFFIWVGLKVSEVMNQTESEFSPVFQSDGHPAVSWISDFLGALISPIIAQLLKVLILFGIMMGGLVAAQELGIKVADSGIKMATGAGNWAKMKAGRATGSRLRNIGKRYDAQKKETTTLGQRIGSRLQSVPVLKHVPGFQAAGQYIAQQGDTRKRYDEDIEKERKKLEGLDNAGIMAAAGSRSVDPAVQAAKAQELARRKLLDPQALGNGDMAKGEKIIEGLVLAAEKMGNDQALYNVRPELVKYSKKGKGMPSIEAAIAEVVKKIPVGEAAKISHPSLGSQNAGAPVSDEIAAAFLSLGNGHFAKIGVEGSIEQQEAVRNTLNTLIGGTTASGRNLSVEEIEEVLRVQKHLTDNANWSYP